MKALLFFDTYGPVFIASISGALLFAITQSRFQGRKKILAFFISFIMGIIGADNTSRIIARYIPMQAELSKEIGAFICSALVVTVMTYFTSRISNTQAGNDKEEK